MPQQFGRSLKFADFSSSWWDSRLVKAESDFLTGTEMQLLNQIEISFLCITRNLELGGPGWLRFVQEVIEPIGFLWLPALPTLPDGFHPPGVRMTAPTGISLCARQKEGREKGALYQLNPFLFIRKSLEAQPIDFCLHLDQNLVASFKEDWKVRFLTERMAAPSKIGIY